MKLPNYRTTISIGSGKEAEEFMEMCGQLATELHLINTKGEPNYSALFRRGMDALSRELEAKAGHSKT